MEFTMMSMYWLVKLDDIRNLLIGSSFAVGVVGSLVICFTLLCTEGEILERRKLCAYTVASFVLMLSILSTTATFIPSTKQMAAIFVLPKIVNNDQVQELPNKILELSTAWLEELKPNTAEPTAGK